MATDRTTIIDFQIVLSIYFIDLNRLESFWEGKKRRKHKLNKLKKIETNQNANLIVRSQCYGNSVPKMEQMVPFWDYLELLGKKAKEIVDYNSSIQFKVKTNKLQFFALWFVPKFQKENFLDKRMFNLQQESSVGYSLHRSLSISSLDDSLREYRRQKIQMSNALDIMSTYIGKVQSDYGVWRAPVGDTAGDFVGTDVRLQTTASTLPCRLLMTSVTTNRSRHDKSDSVFQMDSAKKRFIGAINRIRAKQRFVSQFSFLGNSLREVRWERGISKSN